VRLVDWKVVEGESFWKLESCGLVSVVNVARVLDRLIGMTGHFILFEWSWQLRSLLDLGLFRREAVQESR
jgi:hypothetical protein